ncbi:Tyrosinase [Dactylella cylindrospora]|nr:Tyrosinase [Dactylella cylindrospora]
MSSAPEPKIPSEEQGKDQLAPSLKPILPDPKELPTYGMNSDNYVGDESKKKVPMYKWRVRGAHSVLENGEIDPKPRLRMDIDEWFHSKDEDVKKQVHLFLLALKQFQEVPELSPNSYFMMAGIHSVPEYTEIDKENPDDVQTEEKTNFRTGGFCHHGTIKFASWHRPYMALMEEYIQLHMYAIAEKYPEAERHLWTQAASNWRMPYWDPAKVVEQAHYNGTGIPSIVTWPERDVIHPLKGWVTISNPMYSYRFQNRGLNGKAGGRRGELSWDEPEDDDDLSAPINKRFYGNLLYTVRQPYATNFGQIRDPKLQKTTDAEWMRQQEIYDRKMPKANQNNYHIMEIFREDVSFRVGVFNSLYQKNSYAHFASTFRIDEREEFGRKIVPTGVPLEQTHNTIHNYTGGAGHMGEVPVAAFDPIFWFHHANIDRWLAIWERLHGKMEWTEEEAGKNQHQREMNGMPKDPLYPFYRDETTGWTTIDLQDAAVKGTLGYTYKDLDQSVEDLKRQLIVDYDGLVHDLHRPVVTRILEREDDWYTFDDIKVAITYNRFALGGHPFVVHFFLGRHDNQDPATWNTMSARLGSVYNFSAPPGRRNGARCENCVRQRDDKDTVCAAEVSLTQAIIAARLDPGFDTGIITPDRGSMKKFLDENLHCKITKVSEGKVVEVPQKDLPWIKMGLFWRKAKIPSDYLTRDKYLPPQYVGDWEPFNAEKLITGQCHDEEAA